MSVPFNITNHFFLAAEQYPGNIAIVEKNKTITFSELKQQVEETSAYFMQRGIGKGDRVLVFVPMSIDLYRTVLAIFNIGATAVFLDEWVSKERMEVCCQIAKCKAFIGGLKVRLLSIFSQELRRIPIKLSTAYKRIKSPEMVPVSMTSDTALITFTTGSTGMPKAAKRSHHFLQEQFKALTEKINPQPDDVDMPVLPIVLLINLGIGCTSVIADYNGRKPDAIEEDKIIQQIETHKVNRIVASPFFVKKLSEYLLRHKKELSTVTKIFTGGAPVFPLEADLYNKTFTNASAEIVYGSTEAEPISSINASELSKEKVMGKGLNVGIPYRKTKVKIIRCIDEPIHCMTETDLASYESNGNEIGEIIVSGSHVLQDYLNNEEALLRNKIFIEETCWHRTGDSGYLDSEGHLFLTGRCNTLITVDESVISPFIYENFFQTLDGVIMGTILEVQGEVLAVLELENKNNKQTIIKEIKKCEPRITKVVLVDRMPRDPRHNSKIDYAKLAARLAND